MSTVKTVLKTVDSQVRDNVVMIEGAVFSVISSHPCRDRGWHCLTVSKAGWTGTIGRDFPSDMLLETIVYGAE